MSNTIIHQSVKALEILLRNLKSDADVKSVYESYIAWDSISIELGTLLQSLVLEDEAMTPELFTEWFTSEEPLAKDLYENWQRIASQRGISEHEYLDMVRQGDHLNAIFHSGDAIIKRVHDMASKHARQGDLENKLGLYNAVLKYIVDLYNNNPESRIKLTLFYPEIGSRYNSNTMRTPQLILSGDVEKVLVPGIPERGMRADVYVKDR